MYHNSIWIDIDICVQYMHIGRYWCLFKSCDTFAAVCGLPTSERLFYLCQAINVVHVSFSDCCSHFFVHGGWFDYDGWIMDNLDKIRHIPATVVHGRYDVVCPAKNAWDLHKVCVVLYALHARCQKHRLACVLSVIKCLLHRVGRCTYRLSQHL